MNPIKPRARDIGIPFDGIPGYKNSLTDVEGVEVGHSTIISDIESDLITGKPIRTGVTAIFPRGKKLSPVYANWYSLNGNGEMTGTHWVTESGFLETPIMITNTNSVGVVRDYILKWYVEQNWYGDDKYWYTYPLVAETYDGFLNDIYGFNVKEHHVLEAINNANTSSVVEGNVGGGTGMMCLGFKGGIGSSSRVFQVNNISYTLGVLVQANFGTKEQLRIAGVQMGSFLKDIPSKITNGLQYSNIKEGDGSIIVVVATNAPLLPHQLKRVAQRVSLGIGLVGGIANNGSGDIFIAFSSANEDAFNRKDLVSVTSMANDLMDPIFEATVQATEEAIINAMFAAETMEGVYGNTSFAIPHETVLEVLKSQNRI